MQIRGKINDLRLRNMLLCRIFEFSNDFLNWSNRSDRESLLDQFDIFKTSPMNSNVAHHHKDNFRLELDIKKKLRHAFTLKMRMREPYYLRETGSESNLSDKVDKRGAIEIRLDCSLRMFQFLLSTLTDIINAS